MLAPTATPEQLAALRDRVAALLVGGTCARIGFRMTGQMGGVHVRPGGYSMIGMAVAAAPPVQEGFIRHRQIGVAVRRQRAGSAASYSPLYNRLSFPDHNYGNTPPERASIVHEATHAVYDYLRFRVTRMEAEAGAYIAESIFNRLEGLDDSHAASPVRRVAWEISASLVGTPGGAVALVDAELQRRLIHEIVSRPVYQGIANLYERARFDGGRI